MSAHTQNLRLHHEAFEAVKRMTNWDDDTVWKFIEVLPYSSIPDAGSAVAVLVFLLEHPSLLLADQIARGQAWVDQQARSKS